jgi:hypothetical protein
MPSINLPRYTWPDVISRVMTWPYVIAISRRTRNGRRSRQRAHLGFVQELDRNAYGACHGDGSAGGMERGGQEFVVVMISQQFGG